VDGQSENEVDIVRRWKASQYPTLDECTCHFPGPYTVIERTYVVRHTLDFIYLSMQACAAQSFCSSHPSTSY
jgi:hypothetical protein